MGEDSILSASSRPTEPVISELEMHKASSNKPRPIEIQPQDEGLEYGSVNVGIQIFSEGNFSFNHHLVKHYAVDIKTH